MGERNHFVIFAYSVRFAHVPRHRAGLPVDAAPFSVQWEQLIRTIL